MKLVVESDGATRLDLLVTKQLRRLYPDLRLSRRRLKPYFAADRVRIGERARSASAFLPRGTHEVEIEGWDARAEREVFEAKAAPQGAFIPVVYEDGEILVFDKPAGVAAAPHSGAETGTAVNAALALCPELRQVGNSRLEPGLLHRLDTATRGLLLFAKTRPAYLRLKRQWKAGEVIKIYRARVAVPPRTGFIKFPLGHARRTARKMIALVVAEDAKRIRGRPLPARTEILEVHQEAPERHRLTIRLHTGVMHQIRCHLAAVGSPIIGDELYGGPPGAHLHLTACKLVLPGHGEIHLPE